MGIIGVAAKLVNKKQDSLTSISISLLVTLIINPFSINEIGVKLSYLGTIGIILFNKNIENLLEKKIPNKISKIFSVTISAQIAIMPIIAYKFNSISISFFISNFFASPILGIIIILGFLTIFISFISFKLAKIFAIILNLFLKLLNLIAKLVSKIPFFTITIVTPYLISITVLYSLILICNYTYNIYNSKKIYRKFEKKIIKRVNNKSISILIITIITFIILFNGFYYTYKSVSGILHIHFVDVGQGDCTFIVTPNNKKILIDGGEGVDEILVSYLLDRRVKSIDYVIVSHFDSDHVRGSAYSNGRTKSRASNYFKTRRRF